MTTKNYLLLLWLIPLSAFGYWAYQKQQLADMQEQQFLYENGFKSEYGTKPGCDGEGRCGAQDTSGMNLQQDVKKQFKVIE